MDKVADIKALYLGATRATVARDLERAIAILKSMASDEERERAAVYMDGLAEMKADWAAPRPAPARRPPPAAGEKPGAPGGKRGAR